MIRGLERRGWTVDLIEPSYARAGSAPGPAGRLLEFARIQLHALARIRRADVVYVRAHFAALPVSIIAALMGRPVVQELNGIYDDMFLAWPSFRRLGPLLIAAQRLQLRRASLVIAVTEGLRTWATKDAHLRRTATVPNGANVDLFTPEGARLEGLPDRFAGFVGSLARWHGVDTMLRAVTDRYWPEGVPLVIVGDGAGEGEVRAAAARDERIRYLGRQPYRTVPEVVRAAKVMLSVQTAVPTTVTARLRNPSHRI
jgi:glycosyltransferase involved in cell wall biosynthesis